jgi:hypothetical protein
MEESRKVRGFSMIGDWLGLILTILVVNIC